MTLALEYRPIRFDQLAGQVPVAAVLYQMALRRTVPSGLILSGPRGSGKTSGARILGASLNCEAERGPAAVWPCGVCPQCKAVHENQSLNVIEVDAASNGTVDRIRDIRDQAMYGTAGEYQLYILDEAHMVTPQGFNALLKLLEEPPPGIIFALLTTEPGKILPTIASRCHTFPFEPIPPGVIRSRLEYICADRGFTVEQQLLHAIAERAGGAMRDAVMMLEQVTSVGISNLASWQTLLGETDFAPALIAAAADGDLPRTYAELDKAMALTSDYGWVIGRLVMCMRDILVLASGGTVARHGTQLAARQGVAAQLTPARVIEGLRVLWDLQTRVRTEERSQGLQMAAALLSDALRPARDLYLEPTDCGTGTSIDDLRALVGRS